MSGAMSATIEPHESLEQHVDESRRLGRSALAVFMLGLVPVAAWLAFAPLSSAVLASAFVKVDLDRRVIQHAEGGTVREVKVRDGQQVTQGEPLLVLGDVSVDSPSVPAWRGWKPSSRSARKSVSRPRWWTLPARTRGWPLR